MASSELKKDLEELNLLLTKAIRPNIKTLLSEEITKVNKKLREEEKLEAEKSTTKSEVKGEEKPSPGCYTTKITKYAFDDSLANVKLYVSIKEIQKIGKEGCTCQFGEQSFHFVAHNLNGKNHSFQINSLAYKIKPDESLFKVKNDEVVIILKKADKGQKWEHLTLASLKSKQEKDEKMKDTPKSDPADPQAGIMDLMRKMYDEGDDEMKRMINKTWSESQSKRNEGGMPGMPGMPGL